VFQKILHCLRVRRFRFPISRPDDVSSHPDAQLSRTPVVRTTSLSIRTPFSLKHHPFERRVIPSRPSPVSRSFYSSLHPSGRLSSPSGRLSADQASDSFQVQIREDCCNCPDNVDSRLDARLLKASSQFKLNRLNAYLPRSGRTFNRFGKLCVEDQSSGWPSLWSGRAKP
jgi:hypothetical protein